MTNNNKQEGQTITIFRSHIFISVSTTAKKNENHQKCTKNSKKLFNGNV